MEGALEVSYGTPKVLDSETLNYSAFDEEYTPGSSRSTQIRVLSGKASSAYVTPFKTGDSIASYYAAHSGKFNSAYLDGHAEDKDLIQFQTDFLWGLNEFSDSWCCIYNQYGVLVRKWKAKH